MSKRKQHAPEFRPKVALGKGAERPCRKLASAFGVHPTISTNGVGEDQKRSGEIVFPTNALLDGAVRCF